MKRDIRSLEVFSDRVVEDAVSNTQLLTRSQLFMAGPGVEKSVS